MELNVKGTVFVELGPQTLALLTGNALSAPVKNEVKAEPKAEAPKVEAKPEAPKPAAPAPKPAKEAAPSFEDMDDEARLEVLKAEVTKHTKKGKSADIKFILAQYDAPKTSEMDPAHYADFYNALQRYGKGEDLADIFPNEDLG